jgi:hypothetical protein
VKLELAMRRSVSGHTLIPDSLHDAEAMEGISRTTPFMVTVHQSRNVEHHKKLWAVATKVADFCDDFHDAEDAVEWVKLQIPSMRREYVFNDGKVVMATKSISFAALDQVRFARFYDRAMALWSMRIGCDPETLEAA